MDAMVLMEDELFPRIIIMYDFENPLINSDKALDLCSKSI